MLITLKTTSRDNTSRFSNFFPEGLKIPPNAELGLVNIAYNINKPIALNGANNTFQIRLGNQTAFSNINLVQQTYDNVAALAAEIQRALRAWIATQSAHIQSLFPADSQTVVVSAGHVININLEYDPASINLESWNTTLQGAGGAARPRNAGIIGTGLIEGDGGGYVLDKINQTAGELVIAEDLADNTQYVLAATKQIGKDFFAVWEFSAPQTEQNYTALPPQLSVVALCSTARQPVAEAPILLTINPDGTTIEIKEMVNGTQAVVSTAPNYTYTPGETIQIRIPLFTDTTTAQIAEYYGGTTEIPCKPLGVERLNIVYNDTFFPVFAPFISPQIGKIQSDGAGGNVAIQTPQATTMSEAGRDFKVGYIATQNESTGAGVGCSVMISDTNDSSMGEVLDFTFVNVGTGHVNGDVLTFYNPAGQNTSPHVLKISIDAMADSFRISNPGTNYSNGGADLLNADGSPFVGTPVNVILTTTAGVITQIALNNPEQSWGYTGAGTQYMVNQLGSNNDALVALPGFLNNFPVGFNGFAGSLSSAVANEDPLESQDVIHVRFNEEPLRQLLDVDASYQERFKGGLKITGNGAVVHNNTSSHLLHVQVDEFELESREAQKENAGGVNGKTIASLCAGQEAPGGTQEGFFYKEQFNIIYNKLHNPQTVNHNELNVRLTDEENNPFVGLQHPVVLTLDLKPDLK